VGMFVCHKTEGSRKKEYSSWTGQKTSVSQEPGRNAGGADRCNLNVSVGDRPNSGHFAFKLWLKTNPSLSTFTSQRKEKEEGWCFR